MVYRNYELRDSADHVRYLVHNDVPEFDGNHCMYPWVVEAYYESTGEYIPVRVHVWCDIVQAIVAIHHINNGIQWTTVTIQYESYEPQTQQIVGTGTATPPSEWRYVHFKPASR